MKKETREKLAAALADFKANTSDLSCKDFILVTLAEAVLEHTMPQPELPLTPNTPPPAA